MTLADTDIWLATGENGIFRRGISGAKPWKSLNTGLGSLQISSLAGDPAMMYAGTYDGLYSTVDRGQNWVKNTDLPPCQVGGISVKGDTVFIMTNCGMFYSKNRGMSFSGASSMDFFGGPSIYLGTHDVYVGTTAEGVWKKPWREIRTLHLACDSVIVGSPAGSADSLFIECDTNWVINDPILPYFSASRMSGKGDGYVVFTALQTNTSNNDNIASLELQSVLGPTAGFSVKQRGKGSGVGELVAGSVSLYPNPSSGTVNVSCSDGLIQSVSVLDVSGQELRRIDFTGSGKELRGIDFNGVSLARIKLDAKGVLFLKVVTTKGVAVVKVVNLGW